MVPSPRSSNRKGKNNHILYVRCACFSCKGFRPSSLSYGTRKHARQACFASQHVHFPANVQKDSFFADSGASPVFPKYLRCIDLRPTQHEEHGQNTTDARSATHPFPQMMHSEHVCGLHVSHFSVTGFADMSMFSCWSGSICRGRHQHT